MLGIPSVPPLGPIPEYKNEIIENARNPINIPVNRTIYPLFINSTLFTCFLVFLVLEMILKMSLLKVKFQDSYIYILIKTKNQFVVRNMLVKFRGKVFTGIHKGTRYTSFPWVVLRIREVLGFEPFPGTLNISVSPEYRISEFLRKNKGAKIEAKKGYYSGQIHKVLINGRVEGGFVKPDVPGYLENVVELVAPVSLREMFDLEDGDEVEVILLLEYIL
jgi:riboflavin kinase